MMSRNVALGAAIVLAVVDAIIPVPIFGLIVIWVIAARPPRVLETLRAWYAEP